MAPNNSGLAAHLSGVYKGIGGFYVLNRSGDLGYFSPDGSRLLRETFPDTGPEIRDPFLSELKAAVAAAPPGPEQELGYLLPVDDARVWHTATLVLNDHIARELRDAFDRAISQGRMTLDEGDRRARDMSAERGLHRGIEDLFNHVGAFGTHRFFPVLYFRSSGGEDGAGPMVRVVNLLSVLPGSGRFGPIMEVMRRRLVERGALNEASRVEHRFTLQDE